MSVTFSSGAVLARPLPADGSAPPRQGVSVGARLLVGYGGLLLLLAVLTGIAAFHTTGSVRLAVLVLGIGGVAGGVLLAGWLARGVTAPVREAPAVARRISSGDLTGAIDVRGGGELGRLMQSLGEMHDRLFSVVSRCAPAPPPWHRRLRR
ncbi:HAMP domain-containing protein [Ramlibacter terrae]|uniref:HAMP domain-containing protein n=1 Tax=Ramlibacter terrae TaxID=2732511 RepID=A0ABX6P5P2_9BURK|nr:HAMP domain-containing protein [Ramlibacter terrae]